VLIIYPYSAIKILDGHALIVSAFLSLKVNCYISR